MYTEPSVQRFPYKSYEIGAEVFPPSRRMPLSKKQERNLRLCSYSGSDVLIDTVVLVSLSGYCTDKIKENMAAAILNLVIGMWINH